MKKVLILLLLFSIQVWAGSPRYDDREYNFKTEVDVIIVATVDSNRYFEYYRQLPNGKKRIASGNRRFCFSVQEVIKGDYPDSVFTRLFSIHYPVPGPSGKIRSVFLRRPEIPPNCAVGRKTILLFKKGADGTLRYLGHELIEKLKEIRKILSE